MSNVDVSQQIQSDLNTASENANSEIEQISDSKTLKDFENRYLGKESAFLLSRQNTKNVEPSERPVVGKALNAYKESIEALVASKASIFAEKENQIWNISFGYSNTKGTRRHIFRYGLCPF